MVSAAIGDTRSGACGNSIGTISEAFASASSAATFASARNSLPLPSTVIGAFGISTRASRTRRSTSSSSLASSTRPWRPSTSGSSASNAFMSSIGSCVGAAARERARQFASMKVWRRSAYEPIRLDGKRFSFSTARIVAGDGGVPGVCPKNAFQSMVRGPANCTVRAASWWSASAATRAASPRRPGARSPARKRSRVSLEPRKTPDEGSTRATAKPWARSDSTVASGSVMSAALTSGVTYWFQCAPGAFSTPTCASAESVTSAGSMNAATSVLPLTSNTR